jgi:hypothetical protein
MWIRENVTGYPIKSEVSDFMVIFQHSCSEGQVRLPFDNPLLSIGVQHR